MVEDPPWIEGERQAGGKIDYIGLALIVTGVACFQFVLDKGQENDWFASPLITTMFSIGVPLLAAFFLWEWFHPDPIVDMRLLKIVTSAPLFSFILRVVLFGSTVLIPQFLQTSLGYTAERAGMALSPGGLVLILMMPIAGRLTGGKIDPRILVCLGFLGTSLAPFLMLKRDFRLAVACCASFPSFPDRRYAQYKSQPEHQNLAIHYSGSCPFDTMAYLGIDFQTIVILRMIQVIFLPLIFVPISTLNYVGVPRENNNQVSESRTSPVTWVARLALHS